MANKFVALLLLVSLVAAVQGDDEYVTPEECYNYCFHAMLMPAPVADTICRWRCKFPMWAAACKLQFIIFLMPSYNKHDFFYKKKLGIRPMDRLKSEFFLLYMNKPEFNSCKYNVS
ncbi:hypothetical protein QL285_073010 [Trifolium repens]|jgi:hypothetical protein|nr:hypothetical protein QL285_073010 [Trifolium repens]